MSDRRSPLEIMRSAAYARIGWNHAGLVVAGPLLLALVRLGGYALAFVALVFGVFYAASHWSTAVLAGLTWLVGVVCVAVAGFAPMRKGGRVVLALTAGLFIAASVLHTMTKG